MLYLSYMITEDKRFKYFNWMVLGWVVFNFLLALTLTFFTDEGLFFMIFAFINFLLTRFAVVSAQSNWKIKNWLGYGVPAICFAVVPFAVYFSVTCSGFLCGLGWLLLYLVCGWVSVETFFFYFVGTHVQKWGLWFIKTMIALQAVAMLAIPIIVLILSLF